MDVDDKKSKTPNADNKRLGARRNLKGVCMVCNVKSGEAHTVACRNNAKSNSTPYCQKAYEGEI